MIERIDGMPAGTIGLSGFMPTVEDFELDLSDVKRYRAAIGHGAAVELPEELIDRRYADRELRAGLFRTRHTKCSFAAAGGFTCTRSTPGLRTAGDHA